MKLIDKPLTDKQKKFAEIYCSSKGILSNQECAIEAGYSKDSAYARAHELLNPKICPHVVKYIKEIQIDFQTKYEITKDNHMAELWRIREESKKKNRPLVWLRAEELRGKLMGYYIDKKQTLNVNKDLGTLSEEQLVDKQRQILEQYSHFIDLKEPEKAVIKAEIRAEIKNKKLKNDLDLALRKIHELDPDPEIVRLKKIQEDYDNQTETDTDRMLDEYQQQRDKERKNGKIIKN